MLNRKLSPIAFNATAFSINEVIEGFEYKFREIYWRVIKTGVPNEKLKCKVYFYQGSKLSQKNKKNAIGFYDIEHDALFFNLSKINLKKRRSVEFSLENALYLRWYNVKNAPAYQLDNWEVKKYISNSINLSKQFEDYNSKYAKQLINYKKWLKKYEKSSSVETD